MTLNAETSMMHCTNLVMLGLYDLTAAAGQYA